MRGLYNINPPKPKYNTMWDPHIVLTHLAKWFPLNTLSLKELTQKMVVLLALITAHRIQTLCKIDIDHIKESTENLSIFIPERIKTSNLNKNQPVLIIPFFKENPELCLALTIIEYLKRTKDLRPNETKRLILTIKKPVHPANPQTVSHWIKNILNKCGIDTDIYSGYSCRHAATSAAYRGGANIETIRRAAGWSVNSQMFAKFYHKPILPSPLDFATKVFKGSHIDLDSGKK